MGKKGVFQDRYGGTDGADALLRWFRRSARRMEWRETDDPYRIWISEVMLQQTRVETVRPYYRRFLESFPDVKALAKAPLDRVLKAWEGLGYYARARNLHKAAKLLLAEHEGRLPDTVEELASLPGIGRSTAGAIAAIAYRKDVPILDANVRRVLSRFHAVRPAAGGSGSRRRLWELSRRMVLEGKGRETALALMDLGATVCTPVKPRCGECPFADRCEARDRGLQERIPSRRKGRRLPRNDVVAAFVQRGDGKFLVVRRPDKGLLGGLWGLPGGMRREGETLEEALSREVGGGPGSGSRSRNGSRRSGTTIRISGSACTASGAGCRKGEEGSGANGDGSAGRRSGSWRFRVRTASFWTSF